MPLLFPSFSAARSAFKPAYFLFAVLTLVLASAARLGAVESNGSYVTTEPNVTNWATGWGASGVTGWDYIGQVGVASGVYLGNGWVLTAGHVGAGTFTLGSTAYSYVAGSAQSFVSRTGTADLTLFQIASPPSLPSLTLAGRSLSLTGSAVVMTGFGGGQGETWGENTISSDNISPFTVTSGTTVFVSTDFETTYGGSNQTVLVGGDSGGGDFVYSGGQWLLAGINEAVDTSSNASYMVQVGDYAKTINSIIAVPEPDSAALLGIGASIVLLGRRKRPRSRGGPQNSLAE